MKRKKKKKIEQKHVIKYFKGLEQNDYKKLLVKLEKCILIRLQKKILNNKKKIIKQKSKFK